MSTCAHIRTYIINRIAPLSRRLSVPHSLPRTHTHICTHTPFLVYIKYIHTMPYSVHCLQKKYIYINTSVHTCIYIHTMSTNICTHTYVCILHTHNFSRNVNSAHAPTHMHILGHKYIPSSRRLSVPHSLKQFVPPYYCMFYTYMFYTYKHIHIHTHMYIYTYIYICTYMYIYV